MGPLPGRRMRVCSAADGGILDVKGKNRNGGCQAPWSDRHDCGMVLYRADTDNCDGIILYRWCVAAGISENERKDGSSFCAIFNGWNGGTFFPFIEIVKMGGRQNGESMENIF